jgi:AAA+ superfamily predicted ATPase
MNHLFLPPKLKSIIEVVFNAPTNLLSSDFISGKHGGMVILASGKPGVGKTTTGEAYAEMVQRPLYALDIAELGTTVSQVEINLLRILKRAEYWNCILLFDEVDIFMAKRDDNLERSAIVAIFLRLLDYYKGIMFMTTNRVDVLDDALYSRVTMRIDYPSLTKEYRLDVWKDKLDTVGLEIKDGLNEIGDIELNGREIRNMIRLAKILFNRTTTQNEIIEMIDFAYLGKN